MLEEVLSELDSTRFEELGKRFPEIRPYPGPGKYLDLRTWMRRHLVHLQALDLLDGPPRRILDLGTGNGYFPYLCGRRGHRVVALDLDTFAFYNELTALLGIDRRAHRILAFEPLPDLGGPFDLVTAFNVSFDAHYSPQMWNAAEWDFFLRDVATRQLQPEGRIFVKLNPFKLEGYDAEALYGYLRGIGAEVEPPFFDIRALDALRSGS